MSVRMCEPLSIEGGERKFCFFSFFFSLFEKGRNFFGFFINCTGNLWFWQSDFEIGAILVSVRYRLFDSS